MGIISSGQDIETPFSVVNFQDNSECMLGKNSYRKRKRDEKVCAIVVHSTAGIPGGKDLREQTVKDGAGPCKDAGPFYAKMWNADKTRKAGAHFVIDWNGQIYQLCDLVDDAAFHAGLANGHSVGVEVRQDRNSAGFFEAQIESNTQLVIWLTAFLGIQRQIQTLPFSGYLERLSGKLENQYIVAGHRDLTSNRGAGDPGDYLMQALADSGFEQFDFGSGEDSDVWKTRQIDLGIMSDGIPGPATVRALEAAGYANGLWVQI